VGTVLKSAMKMRNDIFYWMYHFREYRRKHKVNNGERNQMCALVLKVAAASIPAGVYP